MTEVRRMWFAGPAGRLEGALRVDPHPRALAVLAHPHPLYGGTMHNPVVFHVDRELHRAGFATLRFNFRGAGSSEGTHDAGRGEVEDVAAAVAWLRGLRPDLPLLLVGYSFGAWCGLRHAITDPAVGAFIAIGLPIRVYGFEEIERLGRPLAVVQGDADEFGSPEEVEELLKRARPPGQLLVVPGARHLFPQAASQVGTHVASLAEGMMGAP